VIGGKWTTSRHLAEKAVDHAVRKLGTKARPCTTSIARLPGGKIDRIETFAARYANVNSASDHLARFYGTRLDEVLAIANDIPERTLSLGTTGDIGAQIVFAAREEMALTLEDAVMRRTGVGQLGRPGEEVLASAADLMAGELGWSAERKRAEIDSLQPLISTAKEPA